MSRDERSERCRRLVLDTALRLFAHQGYGATTVRQIADEAEVSVGAVYHHFPDKESLFRTLIDEYRAISESPRFPFRRAMLQGEFPNNLEQLAWAARDSVRQYRDYQALFFVDMIEFGGDHVRNFYAEVFARMQALAAQDGELSKRVRTGVTPVSAMLLAARIFFTYFQMEILFGIPEPLGKSSAEIVKEVADILRNGIAPQ
jgi:AcrR family transcriptional regulator